MCMLAGCENKSAEDLVSEYAKERAEELAAAAASKVNDEIDKNEKASQVREGIQTASEYAGDAYDYATDPENIDNAKGVLETEKNKTSNFFSFMFGQLKEQWEQTKEDLQKKPSEFSQENDKTLEDASEYDFYGDYTNPWMEAQGIITSSQGNAQQQFKEIIKKVTEQARETSSEIKQNHDTKHPDTRDEKAEQIASENTEKAKALSTALLPSIPEYSGSPYVYVNNNVPFFDDSELTTDVFETYSELDSLGRCGVAYANVCKELMPTTERGSLSTRPSGWNQAKYEVLKDEADNPAGYAVCRMHLIAYTLAAEGDNPLNLVTGSFYCNTKGMEPWELQTSYYIKSHDNAHVLYRCTPIFYEDELMCRGVLMEARSVEDDGLMFCVYCYNVAPGITYDYKTGKSSLSE